MPVEPVLSPSGLHIDIDYEINQNVISSNPKRVKSPLWECKEEESFNLFWQEKGSWRLIEMVAFEPGFVGREQFC